MEIRRYRASDCKELTELFYHTIHTVNARDYTTAQLNAWASGQVDLEKWNQSFLEHYTVVAIENDRIVGFGDIDQAGYLDHLFVHAEYQRKGIATLIYEQLESAISSSILTTHASITARPFFESKGFHVIKEQKVERHGIFLTNFVMEKKKQPHYD